MWALPNAGQVSDSSEEKKKKKSMFKANISPLLGEMDLLQLLFHPIDEMIFALYVHTVQSMASQNHWVNMPT